jgi:predicted nucleotidyltransferase
MAMSLNELLKVKRQEILHLAAKHGADHIRVFGSVARGEARPDSDIDLLVDLAPGRSLMDHAVLILDLQRLLGCRVDVVTERGLRERVRQKVLAEAVPL